MIFNKINANKKLLTTLVIASIGITACSEETNQSPQKMMVNVSKPKIDSLSISKQYPALLEAKNRVVIQSQVSGYLESINFIEGNYVNKGDILFKIESSNFEAAFNSALANYQISIAEMELAKSEKERAIRLNNKNAISLEEVERKINQYEIAKAKSKAAKAAVDLAKVNLEFTTIRSPFSGRISRANVSQGDLISLHTNLAVLISDKTLLARFDMEEKEYASVLNLNDGKNWGVTFLHEHTKKEVPAQVKIIGNEVEEGTGTIRFHAEIDNSMASFTHGMYGKVNFSFGQDNDALLVDEKSIGVSNGSQFLFVVNDEGNIEKRNITTGSTYDGYRHVTQGIEKDDLVLINSLMRVREGLSVVPNETSFQASSDISETANHIN